MKITDKYVFFYGSSVIYSNMYKCSFIVHNKQYSCGEQWMMYAKAMLFGDKDIANQILKENRPGNMKRLGRMVKDFDQNIWNIRAEQCVTHGLLAKFTQNTDLRDQILSTENRILVEASPTDKIWGVGLSENDPLILNDSNWNGLNRLGRCLMTVRELVTLKNYG